METGGQLPEKGYKAKIVKLALETFYKSANTITAYHLE